MHDSNWQYEYDVEHLRLEKLKAENKKLQAALKIVYESLIAKDYIAAIEILSEVLKAGE